MDLGKLDAIGEIQEQGKHVCAANYGDILARRRLALTPDGARGLQDGLGLEAPA